LTNSRNFKRQKARHTTKGLCCKEKARLTFRNIEAKMDEKDEATKRNLEKTKRIQK